MKLQDHPPIHLTYCLNVHPGESWQENFAAIGEHAMEVRRQVAAGRTFGLGLRLSAQAAETLGHPKELAAFAQFLQDNSLYVFTINGFPYGPFHGRRVKQDVYRPDWCDSRRRNYTVALANILSAVLPPGLDGSISTVPCSYKGWVRSGEQIQQMSQMLADTAMHLDRTRQCTGKTIRLALEMEPDCFLETTAEAVGFLAGPLQTAGARHLAQAYGLGASEAQDVLRRHVGVCFDTAHLACQFEDLAEGLALLRREQIAVAKVQLSSALTARPDEDALRRLEAFCDPVYLHQVKARLPSGQVVSFADLPDALSAARDGRLKEAEWRVHFHVPLFFAGTGRLGSTSRAMTMPFAEALRAGASSHLEIETYTFNVLPDSMRPAKITDGIVEEFQWVRANLL